MQKQWDAVVVGTGPAGLAFAITAADLGLKVLAVDEQATPGGQIYRNIEAQNRKSLRLLGEDYRKGRLLVRKFRQSSAEYLPEATVWKFEPDGRICYSSKGSSTEIRASRIVIATGAMERPVPFPGWTLPGVIGVGAADTLYKSAGIVPRGPVAMVGNGPLMLSTAIHLHGLGVEISHFLESKPRFSTIRAFPHLPMALARPGYLLKGSAMLVKTEKISGNRRRDITEYAACGNGKVEKLSFKSGRKKEEIRTASVLVHEGVVPRTEFARQLRLGHRWDPVQRCWHPVVDRFGRAEKGNIHIAGDGAFVHGAVAAEIKGMLAAIDIAADLKLISPREKQALASPELTALKRELAPRPFVDAVYRPRPNLYSMDDDTMVCRCEEVTAQQIRLAIIQGMKTPEMVKSLTRCGMGPCRSSMCGSALTELIAGETGRMIEEMKPMGIRPPVRNITVGELTRMELLNNPGGN